MGDRIRIVNPVFVDRVGYPLTPKIVFDELNTPANRQLIIDMLREFDVPVHYDSFSAYNDTIPDGMVKRVLNEVAYETVRVRHFGGDTRSLYTREIAEHKDSILEVYDKKIVRTGKRQGPTGWGEDAEPGFLYDGKSHVLLAVIVNGAWDYPLWIEKENVELQS